MTNILFLIKLLLASLVNIISLNLLLTTAANISEYNFLKKFIHNIVNTFFYGSCKQLLLTKPTKKYGHILLK